MTKALKALAVLGGLLGMIPTAAAAPPELFGTLEFRAESLAALPQWQRTLQRIERERDTYRACARSADACPSPGVGAWQAMLEGQAERAPLDQLQAVNRFLNNWRYKADAENYGQRDYWATPLEFLRQSGDCEDYAIAKYVSLRQLGFPAEHLRMVVLRDVLRDLAHAVLAVYLDDQIYILDNLTRAVLPQEQLTHYVPYYSVNETTRWAHVPQTDTLVSSAADRSTPSVGSR
ncbi:MAG TPA: transglutaminase-like cysteine peptidase [Geminicoccaceae bacterium]|nr:transglutaminase-like cysteine peptidase [Geminicoccaceae bacterium]